MPAIRHLRNAPVSEAIIDLRTKARPGFRPEEFESLKPPLAELGFPKMDRRRGLEATFEIRRVGEGPPVIRAVGLQGLFFKTPDEKNVAQFRVDGFTFNRLKPYTSWEEIFPLAMRLWQLYYSVSEPETVSRLAVRYINHVPLSPRDGNLDRYLRATLVIPPELPQDIRHFLTRVTLHDSSRGLSAHVSQALEMDPGARTTTLIVDIDAYKEAHQDLSEADILATFEGLRAFKNEIFFNILTEETIRMFE